MHKPLVTAIPVNQLGKVFGFLPRKGISFCGEKDAKRLALQEGNFFLFCLAGKKDAERLFSDKRIFFLGGGGGVVFFFSFFLLRFFQRYFLLRYFSTLFSRGGIFLFHFLSVVCFFFVQKRGPIYELRSTEIC